MPKDGITAFKFTLTLLKIFGKRKKLLQHFHKKDSAVVKNRIQKIRILFTEF